MANILLTEKCVRSCPYCFAKKHMADAPDNTALKWDDLIYLTDLFVASKIGFILRFLTKQAGCIDCSFCVKLGCTKFNFLI